MEAATTKKLNQKSRPIPRQALAKPPIPPREQTKSRAPNQLHQDQPTPRGDPTKQPISACVSRRRAPIGWLGRLRLLPIDVVRFCRRLDESACFSCLVTDYLHPHTQDLHRSLTTILYIGTYLRASSPMSPVPPYPQSPPVTPRPPAPDAAPAITKAKSEKPGAWNQERCVSPPERVHAMMMLCTVQYSTW
ncbi:uncharacterized protein K452DRAFT_313936 [Aplosporella prunicola CBS 121167]|uniref:Uncharacterized protein n=1 Tax=Aplosporella prunicola CBS 121167 TaxID=1176127 RepID=A0A6A6AV75_9PEZI|nr:uncharacterized protein K452DRAFT_313936 [Aplosporella prunicola CBS 121167]KAF2135496.1 hypothetical protein K452DRAFT_313936 [Aplosporella prunicola CBS 121167]